MKTKLIILLVVVGLFSSYQLVNTTSFSPKLSKNNDSTPMRKANELNQPNYQKKGNSKFKTEENKNIIPTRKTNQNTSFFSKELMVNEKTHRYNIRPDSREHYSPEEHRQLLDDFSDLDPSESNIGWFEVGPNNVGGRTRALCLDRTNSNTLIAAGATGGIWKSTDAGNSWSLKSDLMSNHSITSIIQHPNVNNEWYAVSGEYWNSSGRFISEVFGAGVVYKSINNGDSWEEVANAQSPENYLYLTSRIDISPTTGTFFVATHGFGIARSTDNGASFDLVLGDENGSYNLDESNDNFIFNDVIVASDGTVLAYLSGELSDSAGFYKSVDDGISWVNITPTSLEEKSTLDLLRSVFALAPSNPNVAYAFTAGGTDASEYYTPLYFHKIDISSATFDDRSSNLPALSTSTDTVSIPGVSNGYNMAISVKPDDEDFVLLGGASGGPFRTFDGYATPSGTYADWADLHSSPYYVCKDYIHNDQHVFVFDPNNTETLWVGNDGGVYKHTAVSGDNFSTVWENKNNGFNVTQFYDLAIAPFGQGNFVLGGTQDNAHRLVEWNTSGTSPYSKEVISGGDGTLTEWREEYIYTTGVGGPTPVVFDPDALFQPGGSRVWGVHEGILTSPYVRSFTDNYVAVNPNNENIIFVSKGLDEIYKSTVANNWKNMSPTSSVQNSFTTYSIEDLPISNSWEYGFLAMSYSTSPEDILYFSVGTTLGSSKPKIFKLENASTAPISSAVEISSPLFPEKGQICDIAINSEDANEFIVVMSNHNKNTLFYTNDGGITYTDIEGNLDSDTYSPALRAAEIVTVGSQKIYLLGTTYGLVSTNVINGDLTNWKIEGKDVLGACPISDIDFRSEDQMIGVATHGRGIFMGNAQALSLEDHINSSEENQWNVYPNTIPKEGTFYLQWEGSYKTEVTVCLYDLNGKKLTTFLKNALIDGGSSTPLNIHDVPNGVYLLQIKYKNDQKVILETIRLIR